MGSQSGRRGVIRAPSRYAIVPRKCPPPLIASASPVAPLEGLLVVDLTRYLPGPFASRELLRLGARVVRIEPPGGDPMRVTAPAWHEVLNAGKGSITCDLKAEPARARALGAEA